MSISISSNTHKNLIDNKEFRYPKCSLNPFINISSNNNKINNILIENKQIT